MRTALLFALPLFSSAVFAETLYNGIELPESWPPRQPELTRAALAEPPYLKARPKVIPIDVGRQLFVDDFLIEGTSLKRTHHLPEPYAENPVISADKPWEGKGSRQRAGVFSDGVWFDPKDQLFKAWYWSGAISEQPLKFATSYATSKDGLHWEKPLLDVVPGTNIVQPDEDNLRRNSSTVWLDQSETDLAKRFKMFRVVQEDIEEKGKKTHHNFIRHSVSADGIHWQKVGDSTDCGDRSTVFFNAFRQRWIYSLRVGGTAVSRCRGYVEAADPAAGLKFGSGGAKVPQWIGADELDAAREDLKLRRLESRPWDLVPSQLYNLDGIAYESVMLGLFTIWRGHPVDEVKRPKINEVCVGFSRDGFHWSRPDRRPICGVNEDPKAWNFGNVQSAGGCCLIVGDKLHFYFGGTQWLQNGSRHADPNCTGLMTLRRDGFASMDAGDQSGTLTTRSLSFKGRHLFVNVDAGSPNGKLLAEIQDESGKAIPPFTTENCIAMQGDKTRAALNWKGAEDLSALSGKIVRIKFTLTSGQLYAFWVTPDKNGASQGFVAAGGPGLTGVIDAPAKTP